MTEGNDKNVRQLRERKWTRVNFCAALTALVIAFTDGVLLFIFSFCKVDIWAQLYVFIALSTVALTAVGVLIVSWWKLRRLKRLQDKTNTDVAELADASDLESDG